MNHTTLFILALILMMPALIAVWIPVVPAVPYMALIALLFAIADGFTHLTGSEWAVLLGIAIVSVIVDQVSGVLGAKYGGASKKAMLFGFLGALVGTFVLPPFGGFLGVFVGILIAEFTQFKDQVRALRAATGGLLGALAGVVVNFILALILLITFVLLALR